MFKRDYVMRLIEEFARFLAMIVGLKLEGKLDEAMKTIEGVYGELLDLDPKGLKSMDQEELLKFLQGEKQFDYERLKMVAELLYQEGMIYAENGDPVTARNVLEKSKMLIDFLMENDSTFSFDWYDKLHDIDNVLGV